MDSLLKNPLVTAASIILRRKSSILFNKSDEFNRVIPPVHSLLSFKHKLYPLAIYYFTRYFVPIYANIYHNMINYL